MLLSLPFVLIGAVEFGLRLAGVYATERSPFIELDGRPDYMGLNPEYAAKYFNGFVPSVAFNPFRTDKEPGTFRIVALGGSSTAGFPYQFYYGFPESLARRLSVQAPSQPIEVINLGMTAVNSYTLWDLRNAVFDIEPDAVVIYAGHNEFYGAFGAGSTLYSLGNVVWFKRAALRLKRSVLYLFLEKLLTRRPDPGEVREGGDDRTLMARVVRDATIELNDPIYKDGVRQFERNMGDFLDGAARRGIPIFMGTLVSNLSGQKPLGSNQMAGSKFEEASALLVEDVRRADSLFRYSRDLDNIRFRASSDINDVIESFGENPGITIVDTRKVFMGASGNGVPGYDLFVDHLHPTVRGYDLLGEAFFESMKDHPSLTGRPGTWHHDSKLDPFAASHSSLLIARLLFDYPFVKNRTPQEISAYSDGLVRSYRNSGSLSDSLAAALVSGRLNIQNVLFDGLQESKARSDTASVLAFYEALFHWQPLNDDFRQAGVSYALNNPASDSLTLRLAALGARNSRDIFYWNALGAVLLRSGNLEGADRAMVEAETIDAESEILLFNRARYHVVTGDTASARLFFNRYQAATQN